MARPTVDRQGGVVGFLVGVGALVLAVWAIQWTFDAERWVDRAQTGPPIGQLTFWVTFLVVSAAVVAVHETGHAVVGALVGFRPFRVVVGTGPTLARFEVGSTKVELRLFAFSGGLTEMATRRPEAIFARHAVAVLGGPLVPVVIGILLVRWDAPSFEQEMVRVIAIAIVVITTVSALVPYRAKGMHSDGMHLLECIRQHPEARRGLLVAHDALVLREALSSGDHETLGGLADSHDPVIASAAAVEAGHFDRAVEVARAALADPHPAQLDILRNNLAMALASREGPGDLDEALRLVSLIDQDALGPAAHDTIGLVLLRAGQPAEALPFLRSAFADTSLLPPARAHVAAHLAEAAYASGDAHLGRRSLGVALRAGATDPEVRRALQVALGPEVEVIRGFWASCTGHDEERAAELAGALGSDLRAMLAVLEMVDLDADPELAAIVRALRAVRDTST